MPSQSQYAYEDNSFSRQKELRFFHAATLVLQKFELEEIWLAHYLGEKIGSEHRGFELNCYKKKKFSQIRQRTFRFSADDDVVFVIRFFRIVAQVKRCLMGFESLIFWI